MNADGSAQANLTRTPLLEESPDWQPLPFPEGVGAPGHPRAVCGDLSLAPGGVVSVQSVTAPGRQARRVARAWLAGAKTHRYACTSAPTARVGGVHPERSRRVTWTLERRE